MAAITGYPFYEAEDHFEAQAAKDAAVSASGALKTVATALFKIANDLRWLSSGPRTGIAEIRLPSIQPGSSIMPGKVNPVMSEMVMQVAVHVFGNDAAVTWGAANGNLELNVMMPRHRAQPSRVDLARGQCSRRVSATSASWGSKPTPLVSRDLPERNIIVVTALNPHIGYDKGAVAAKEALVTGRNVRDVIIEKGWLAEEQVHELLDIKRMTEGGVMG